MRNILISTAAVALALTPTIGFAQSATDPNAGMTTVATTNDDDDDFPWGLLGLLGLAGLLGRKKDDRHDHVRS
jgi:MYXO-CTERM domain-containing protein